MAERLATRLPGNKVGVIRSPDDALPLLHALAGLLKLLDPTMPSGFRMVRVDRWDGHPVSSDLGFSHPSQGRGFSFPDSWGDTFLDEAGDVPSPGLEGVPLPFGRSKEAGLGNHAMFCQINGRGTGRRPRAEGDLGSAVAVLTNFSEPVDAGVPFGFGAETRSLWEEARRLLPEARFKEYWEAFTRSRMGIPGETLMDSVMGWNTFETQVLPQGVSVLDPDHFMQVSDFRPVLPVDALLNPATLVDGIMLPSPVKQSYEPDPVASPLRRVPGSGDQQAREFADLRMFAQTLLSILSRPRDATPDEFARTILDKIAGSTQELPSLAHRIESDLNHGWVGYAILNGGASWVPDLLAAGLSAEATFAGFTPLELAVIADQGEAMRCLLSSGLKIGPVPSPERLAMREDDRVRMLEVFGDQRPLDHMALAAWRGSLNVLKVLADEYGVEDVVLHRDRNGFNALHYAAMTDRADVIRWALENGADRSLPVGGSGDSLEVRAYDLLPDVSYTGMAEMLGEGLEFQPGKHMGERRRLLDEARRQIEIQADAPDGADGRSPENDPSMGFAVQGIPPRSVI